MKLLTEHWPFITDQLKIGIVDKYDYAASVDNLTQRLPSRVQQDMNQE
jgi:hypothetical protein